MVIIALILVFDVFDNNSINVTAFDGRSYRVRNLPNKIQAANTLAAMRLKIKNFVKHINNQRLQSKYKEVLMENFNDNYTSYTVEKGKRIYLCLREKDSSDRFIDENTLFFVILHELAHVMTKSIGHTDEFWDNFRGLLRKAIKLGYYEYHPYHITPQKYCGTMITDTPLRNKND